jgi:uncharacterized protein YjbI with pentapeptide repeats
MSGGPLHFTAEEFRLIQSVKTAEEIDMDQDDWNKVKNYDPNYAKLDSFKMNGVRHIAAINRFSEEIMFDWELDDYKEADPDLRCTYFSKRDITDLRRSVISGEIGHYSIEHSMLRDADLSCLPMFSLGFTNSLFNGVTDFSRSVLGLDTRFFGVTFGGSVDFSEAEFSGHAGQFGYTNFCGDAIFRNAHFMRHVNLYNAVFERKADFSHAVFSGQAAIGARFCRHADFSNAVFESRVRFTRTIFKKGADFDNAVFNGPVDPAIPKLNNRSGILSDKQLRESNVNDDRHIVQDGL